MLIIITIALFLIKYLLIAAIGLFMYIDLELTKDISSGIYSIYLTFACITFFSFIFFLLGKKLLWLVVFLIFGGLYIGMYTHNSEIVNAHKKYIEDYSDTFTSAQKLYQLWKMFH